MALEADIQLSQKTLNDTQEHLHADDKSLKKLQTTLQKREGNFRSVVQQGEDKRWIRGKNKEASTSKRASRWWNCWITFRLPPWSFRTMPTFSSRLPIPKLGSYGGMGWKCRFQSKITYSLKTICRPHLNIRRTSAASWAETQR